MKIILVASDGLSEDSLRVLAVFLEKKLGKTYESEIEIKSEKKQCCLEAPFRDCSEDELVLTFVPPHKSRGANSAVENGVMFHIGQSYSNTGNEIFLLDNKGAVIASESQGALDCIKRLIDGKFELKKKPFFSAAHLSFLLLTLSLILSVITLGSSVPLTIGAAFSSQSATLIGFLVMGGFTALTSLLSAATGFFAYKKHPLKNVRFLVDEPVLVTSVSLVNQQAKELRERPPLSDAGATLSPVFFSDRSEKQSVEGRDGPSMSNKR